MQERAQDKMRKRAENKRSKRIENHTYFLRVSAFFGLEQIQIKFTVKM